MVICPYCYAVVHAVLADVNCSFAGNMLQCKYCLAGECEEVLYFFGELLGISKSVTCQRCTYFTYGYKVLFTFL